MTEKINIPENDTYDPSGGNPFIGETEFEKTFTQRSRSFVEANDPHRPKMNESLSKNEKRKLGAVVGSALVLTAAAGTAAPVMVDSLNGPEITGSTTITVQPGEGLYDLIENIPGASTVDATDLINSIKADPANIDIDFNNLQPGIRITIPTEVEP